MSQPYIQAMAMRPAISYIPYATSSKGKTGDKTTFTQFEEGSLLLEYRNDTESGKLFDNNSTLLPVISKAETYVMSSVDESDAEPMSTEIL